MKISLLVALVIASCTSALPAAALPENTANQVTVIGVHNAVELSYSGFLRSFAKLNALLPPEPRHIDLLHRILFTRLNRVEQDEFSSPTWAISIVSSSRDIEVPIVRGGYFLLPIDRVAMEENASIVFNAHIRDRALGLVVKLRTRSNDVIHAADLAAALEEATRFQGKAGKTGFYESPGPINAIKACFANPSGDMIVSRGAGSKTSLGMCKFYVPAESDVSANAEIAFNIAPDIVVLVHVRRTVLGRGD